jgi:hypothetical protein
MADLTDDQVDAIQARLDAATPGPWHWGDDDAGGAGWEALMTESGRHVISSEVPHAFRVSGLLADEDLIAHAPSDLRLLLAAVRRGRRIEKAVREIAAEMIAERDRGSLTQSPDYNLGLEAIADDGERIMAVLDEEPDCA